MPPEEAAEVRLAVFAFGSYRLGVNTQGEQLYHYSFEIIV